LQENEQQLQVSGDAADIALYNLCENHFDLDVEYIRHQYPRLHSLPFNSSNKFMIVANQMSSNGRHATILNQRTDEILLTMKGATDVVLTRDKCCKYKTSSGEIKELTDELRAAIVRRHEQMGSTGYRIIALLQRTIDRQTFDQLLINNQEQDDTMNGFPLDDFIFIGLYSLLDPPRVEVPEAVLNARQAQIRMMMVTGDHPTTAVSIARQVHILTNEVAQNNGFDTFQTIGIDAPTGRPIVQLLRNGVPFTTHILGTLSPMPEEKTKMSTIKMSNDDEKINGSWAKQWWKSINFYFTDPREKVETQSNKIRIAYAMVIKGSDLPYRK
jgi:magnesium-transporting ATPase (P-type)